MWINLKKQNKFKNNNTFASILWNRENKLIIELRFNIDGDENFIIDSFIFMFENGESKLDY